MTVNRSTAPQRHKFGQLAQLSHDFDILITIPAALLICSSQLSEQSVQTICSNSLSETTASATAMSELHIVGLGLRIK